MLHYEEAVLRSLEVLGVSVGSLMLAKLERTTGRRKPVFNVSIVSRL